MDQTFFSLRQIKLFQILLGQDQYLPMDQAAERLGVSTRTLFREIQGINRELGGLSVYLETKTGKGIRLSGDRESFAGCLEEISKRDSSLFYYTKEQRRALLTIEFLKRKHIEKLGYYAYKLMVSEATISNDIQAVRPWFQKHSLALERKAGLGITVTGEEENFRSAIIDFLNEKLMRADVEQFQDSRGEFRALEYFQNLGKNSNMDLLNEEILDKVIKILKKCEDEFLSRITRHSYIGLVIHLVIAIERLLSGKTITMEEELLRALKEDPYYKKAKELTAYFEEEFHIEVPESESAYVFMHLKGARMKYAVEKQDELTKMLDEYDCMIVADDLIAAFGRLMGDDFSQDKVLYQGLASHLRATLHRLNYHMRLENPLLDQIKEDFRDIFAICKSVCKVMETKYHLEVNEDEIAYLSFHFGAAIERKKAQIKQSVILNVAVVCASGIGISSFLSSSIKSRFAGTVRVSPLSVEQVALREAEGMDIIISTLKLPDQGIPVMEVGALLKEEDFGRMQAYFEILKEQKIQKKIPDVKNIRRAVCPDIVENLRIYPADASEGKEEVLRKLLGHTDMGEKQKDRCLEAVMEREKDGPVALKDRKFLIFHCNIPGNNTPVLMFFTLDHKKGTHPDFQDFDKGALMIVDKKQDKKTRDTLAVISEGFVTDERILESLEKKDPKALRCQIREYLERAKQEGDEGLL